MTKKEVNKILDELSSWFEGQVIAVNNDRETAVYYEAVKHYKEHLIKIKEKYNIK